MEYASNSSFSQLVEHAITYPDQPILTDTPEP